jgi:hypothetical protein
MGTQNAINGNITTNTVEMYLAATFHGLGINSRADLLNVSVSLHEQGYVPD